MFFRRLVKNFIWFFKYLWLFFWLPKNRGKQVGSLMLTVDMETAKDFINWQSAERATKHAIISRKAISGMVDLAEKYNLPITWLVTGASLINNPDKPLEYFGDLVDRLVASSAGHEIGSHTYTHPHCASLSREDFETEMRKTKTEFDKKNLPMFSHAYPWNEVGHFESLKSFGIQAVRLKLGKYPSKILATRAGSPKIIYQSLEATPLSAWLIKWGVSLAIKSGRNFVWLLHPENFYYQSDLEIIERVFKFANKKRDREILRIITMKQV